MVDAARPWRKVGRGLEETPAHPCGHAELARRARTAQTGDAAIAGFAPNLHLRANLARPVELVVVQGVLAVVLVQHLVNEPPVRAGHLVQGPHLRHIPGRREESPSTILEIDRADPLIQTSVERAQVGRDEWIVPEGIGADDLGGNRRAEPFAVLRKPRELSPGDPDIGVLIDRVEARQHLRVSEKIVTIHENDDRVRVAGPDGSVDVRYRPDPRAVSVEGDAVRRRAVRQVLGDEMGRVVRGGIVYVDDAEQGVLLIQNRFEVPPTPRGVVERRYDDHEGLQHLPRSGAYPSVVPDTRSQGVESIETWGHQPPKRWPSISPHHLVPATMRGAGPGEKAGMQINMTTFAGRTRHYIHETLQSLLASDWRETNRPVNLIMGSADESHLREYAAHPSVRIVPLGRGNQRQFET